MKPAKKAPAGEFWRAHYYSRNFQFEAFGASRDDALAALRSTLDVHARQYRLEPVQVEDEAGQLRWVSWPESVMQEVEPGDVRPLHLGAGYRDGEAVFPCAS